MTNNSQLTATSDLNEWLYFIENFQPKNCLTNAEIKIIAGKLNLLMPAKKIITITGTNGKGSTCHLLAKFLIDHGYKVGLFTSPHLIEYQERILIQNKKLSEQQHTQALYTVREKFLNLSGYFKYSFLSALYLLGDQNLDFLVVEVGIGGREDITNILDPAIAVITNIDLDHTNILGETKEEIGYQKAGIFRNNCSVVYADQDIPDSVTNYANLLNSRVYQVGSAYTYKQNNNTWLWQYGAITISNLALPKIPMQNVACVLMILHVLQINLDLSIIKDNVKNFYLSGRFEHIHPDKLSRLSLNRYTDLPNIILDVGHNSNAAKYLASKLKNFNKNNKIYTICGILEDKDSKEIFKILSSAVTHWHFISLDGNRGQTAAKLAMKYKASTNKNNYTIDVTMQVALNNAIDHAINSDYILIFGSFHTVEQFLKLI